MSADSGITYRVEYSKTARAKCKNSKCKGDIEKKEMRIGKIYPSDRFTDGGTATDWFHAKCFFETQKRARKTTRKAEDTDDMEGFEDLEDDDQKLVAQLFKTQRDEILSKKPSKKKATLTVKKDKKDKPKSSTWTVDSDGEMMSDDEGAKKKDSSKQAKDKKEKKEEDDNDDFLKEYKFQKKDKKTTPTKTTTTTTTKPTVKKVTLSKVLTPKWFEVLEKSITSITGYEDLINGSRNVPRASEVFCALNSVHSPGEVKVVVFGQTPFNKASKEGASGYAFCDNESKNKWQLQSCRAPAKNLIKQAMIWKGYASKDDDVETLQEILREVELPGESPVEWFKSTAKQGVLWLNLALSSPGQTDGSEESIKQWSGVVDEVIRACMQSRLDTISSQMNSQNPIQGLVFVIPGKQHHAMIKQKIEDIHSEFMGAVPIETLETQSPLLELFNGSDYFNQINKLLSSKLNQTDIDWWKPKEDGQEETSEEEEEEEEEEVKPKLQINEDDIFNNDDDYNEIQKPTTTTTSKTSTKPSQSMIDNGNNNSDGYECFLVKEDGTKFQIELGQELDIGRKNLEINDLQVSRRHANVKFQKDPVTNSYILELTPTGSHPMYLLDEKTGQSQMLQTQVTIELKNKQQFLLFENKYPFIVEIEKKPGTSTPSKSSPKSDESKSTLKRKHVDDEDGLTLSADKEKPVSQKAKTSSQSTVSSATSVKKSPSTPTKSTKKKSTKPPKDKDLDFVIDEDEYLDDSGDDYNDSDSEGGTPYINIPTRSSVDNRPCCKYWDLCYRKNPQHLADFRHP